VPHPGSNLADLRMRALSEFAAIAVVSGLSTSAPHQTPARRLLPPVPAFVMAPRAVAAVAALAALLALASASDEFVNTKVLRRIDAQRHIVTVSSSIKATGRGGSKYYLAFTDAEAAHLSHVAAEAEEGGEVYAVARDESVRQ
jgi:hypothetical protein